MTTAARKYRDEDRRKTEAELAACLDGSWPRDISDSVRYDLPRYPFDPPGVVQQKHREYVASICRRDLEWHAAKDAKESVDP